MRHFMLTCVNHPELRWMTKSIAWTKTSDREGFYNGCRNIFYLGGPNENKFHPECPCKADSLRLAPEENGIDETE